MSASGGSPGQEPNQPGSAGADDAHALQIPAFLGIVEALYDYDAQEPNCMSFRTGNMIYVLERHESGWWEGISQTTSVRGWFPSNFVRPVAEAYTGIQPVDALSLNPQGTGSAANSEAILGGNVASTDAAVKSDFDHEPELEPEPTVEVPKDSTISRAIQSAKLSLQGNLLRKQSARPTSIVPDAGNSRSGSSSTLPRLNNLLGSLPRFGTLMGSMARDGVIPPMTDNGTPLGSQEQLEPSNISAAGNGSGSNSSPLARQIASPQGQSHATLDRGTIGQRSPDRGDLQVTVPVRASSAQNLGRQETPPPAFQSHLKNAHEGSMASLDKIMEAATAANTRSPGGGVLPANWATKTTAEGQKFYYNVLTNQTRWSLTDIRADTGEQLRAPNDPILAASVPSDLPTMSSSTSTGAVAGAPSWEGLIGGILSVISALNVSAKNGEKAKYIAQTNAIVHAVHKMLQSSGTSSQQARVLQSNAQLRSYHHGLLVNVAKLILASRVASGVWPPPDAVQRVRHNAGQVLLSIRHFVSIAQEQQVKLAPLANEEPDDFDVASNTMADGEFVERLETSVAELEAELTGIATKIKNDAMFSMDLIALTKSAVVKVGELLSMVEDLRVPTGEASLTQVLAEFQGKKDLVYTSVHEAVTTARMNADEFAPPNALAMLQACTVTLTKTLRELVVATKHVVEAKNAQEQAVLQGEVAFLEGTRRDSDLSVLQRRAMSLNFIPTSAYPMTPTGTQFGFMPMSPASMQYPMQLGSPIRHEIPPPSATTPSPGHLSIHSRTPSYRDSDSPSRTSSAGTLISDRPARRTTQDLKKHINHAGSSSSSSLESTKLTKFFGEDSASIMTRKTSQPVLARKWYLEYDYGQADLTFNMEGQVNGGTLDALVERLTLHDTTIEQNFLQAFLLNFAAFATPEELIDKLRARFAMSCPAGLTPEEADEWRDKKQTPTRLRVINVLKNWLDAYYVDERDDQCLTGLQELASTVIEPVMAQQGKRLHELITKRVSNMGGSIPIRANRPRPAAPSDKSAQLPTPVPPKFPIKSVVDVDPGELARQLTIFEFKLYSQILPHELVNLDFSKKTKNVALNVKAMIRTSTEVSGWVAESILLEEDVKKRGNIMKFWIKVADKCMSYNNFSTLRSIIGSLDGSTISRLSKTWDLVPTKSIDLLKSLREATDHARNFASMRATLKTTAPPCLPFLGMFLTDLTFIHDGNAKMRPPPNGHLINFDRYAKTTKTISDLLRFNQTAFGFVELSEMQQWLVGTLSSLKTKCNQEELYRLSLQIEPREASPTRGAPRSASGFSGLDGAGGGGSGGLSPAGSLRDAGSLRSRKGTTNQSTTSLAASTASFFSTGGTSSDSKPLV